MAPQNPDTTKKPSPKSKLGGKFLTWKKEFTKKTRLPYLTFLGVLTFSLFSILIYAQQKSLNATELFKDLVTSEKIMPLHAFAAQFHEDCQLQKGVQDCELVSSLDALQLPNVEVIGKHLAGLSKMPRQVVLSHEFSEPERKWMHEKHQFNLVIPGNVQRVTRLRLADRTEVSAGVGTNTAFALEENDFSTGKKLVLEVRFDNLPWFGPANLPVAFAEVNSTGAYQELGAQNRVANSTGKQMQLAIPLILTVMAIFIGQKNIFGVVATFASVRAASIFFAFIIEEQLSFFPGIAFLSLHKDNLMGLLNGLCCACLLSFAFAVAEDKRKRGISDPSERILRNERFQNQNAFFRALETVLRRVETESSEATLFVVKACFFMFFGFGFFIWANYDKNSWLAGDLVSDFVGGTLGALLLAGAISFYAKDEFNFYQREKHAEQKSSEFLIKERRLKFIFKMSKLILACVAFSILAFGNGQDLILNTTGVKGIIQWTYAFLYPAICVIAFLDVGAAALISSLQEPEIESKRELDKELKIAKRFQKLTHPPLKKKSRFWRWRIFHKPATQLSGDWFGVAELKFAGGQQMLLATVLDFCGHGIAPGLSTGIAATAFGEWVNAQTKKAPAPVTPREKAALVHRCMSKIHGALNLNDIDCATASQVFALVDPVASNVLILNGSHPSPFISDGVRLLKPIVISGMGQLGERLSPPEENLFKVVSVKPGDTLMLYSDGLFEVPELNRPFKTKEAAFALNPFSIARKSFDNARKIRALWKTHPEKFSVGLDDITIVCIELLHTKSSFEIQQYKKSRFKIHQRRMQKKQFPKRIQAPIHRKSASKIAS